MYKGVVIKESLKNPGILTGLKVFKTETTESPHWHILWVEADEGGLEAVKNNIGDKWYAHFASSNTGLVIFKDRIFEMDTGDRKTWEAAIDYGKSIGIPDEQLDFEFGELI
jgi:hypothetical protein